MIVFAVAEISRERDVSPQITNFISFICNIDMHEHCWTVGVVICDIIRLTRKSLFLGLVLDIIISDSFIYFAQVQTKAFYSSWIISSNMPKK
jgi:hypothetical protein